MTRTGCVPFFHFQERRRKEINIEKARAAVDFAIREQKQPDSNDVELATTAIERDETKETKVVHEGKVGAVYWLTV